jgi:excisionase family DNA binding protein
MSGKRDLNPRPSPWQKEEGGFPPTHTDTDAHLNYLESLGLCGSETADRPHEPTPVFTNLVTQWLPDCFTGETPGRLFTIAETAERLKVSGATVYKLVANGTLAHLRVSNSIRIRADVLAKYAFGATEGGEGKP